MMRKIHILNGDSLTEGFRNARMEGECIICRECLIDGPGRAAIDESFWERRAEFINNNHGGEREEYYRKVVDEFTKLKHIQKTDEINLWFENDLFCQANYWFILKFLTQLSAGDNLYRVFPLKRNYHSKWSTYGKSTSADLIHSFENRKRITRQDLALGAGLWDAYADKDLSRLTELSVTKSEAFEFLDEVIRAHIERFPKNDIRGRPQKTLSEIILEGRSDFNTIFKEFSRREAIYGFGDTQVKAMLEQLTL